MQWLLIGAVVVGVLVVGAGLATPKSESKLAKPSSAFSATKAVKLDKAAQVKLLKLAAGGDYEGTHALATELLPQFPKTNVGAWTKLWDQISSKLAEHRVADITEADVFHIKSFITPKEAALMKQVVDIVYSDWKVQKRVCFDQEWSYEPAVLKPSPEETWREQIIRAGVLKKRDFEQHKQGEMTEWCLKQTAMKRKTIQKLQRFLNVSRSVMVHRGISDITDTIETRLEQTAGLPRSKAYFAQYLHYSEGEHYNVHTDCFLNSLVPGKDDRYATILLYFSEPEGGGTDFPLLNHTFTPKLGDLVIWRNLHAPSGVCNTWTYHTAQEVTSGEKYVFQKWYNLQNTNHKNFAAEKNSFGCDRNSACREYLYAHQAKGALP